MIRDTTICALTNKAFENVFATKIIIIITIILIKIKINTYTRRTN